MRKQLTHRSRPARPTCRIEPLEARTLMTAVVGGMINGGDWTAPARAQRSVINTISVSFDTNVAASIQNTDLRLWNATTRQFVDTSAATTSYESFNNTATWTFPSPQNRTLLPNGNYIGTLSAMGIYDAAGNPLDGDRDGVGGDEYSFEFHRFFGDADSDRDVDTLDLVRQRRTRHRVAGDPAFNPAFDADGDGDVDTRDTLEFRRNLRRRLAPRAGNRPPAAPVINEPTFDGQLIDPQDLHMQIEQAFVDPDLSADPEGTNRTGTDWEVWTRGPVPERVFRVTNATAFDSKVHVHFGDGVFEGSHAGRNRLLPNTNYLLRVRHRDASGDPGTANSNWDVRLFRTRDIEEPTAPGWVSRQAGYEVQEIPFIFGAGEQDWRLPVNIAFVPEHLRGHDPGNPLFYVNELYGKVRVVTNDFHVYTYATGLLNYNPNGPFGGSGENGLTGLVVDPTNGDLYVTMLYDDLTDTSSNTFPKITRLTSNDGGLHAVDTNASQAGTQGVDILRMPGEPMRQSHIISNISFGPDDKLYVHVGDGFDVNRGRDDLSFRGKILRLNRNGSAPTDNPRYQAADRGSDGRPDAEDYWYVEGLRNPFGGAWRDANPAAGTPAQHFYVENGPSVDRFAMMVRARDYLYDGSNESMRNFNIAYSPTGSFENGARDWDPSPAPVNIAFVQPLVYGGSGFPAEKQGHAFVTQSGSTHSSGPSSRAKLIEEWVLNPDGTRRVSTAGEPANPRDLVKYQGSGYSTAAALAPGPGGLYFSTLYPETNPDPTAAGAKILRVVYTGVAAAPAGDPPVAGATPDALAAIGASSPNVVSAPEPITTTALAPTGAENVVPARFAGLFADGSRSTGSSAEKRETHGVLSLLTAIR